MLALLAALLATAGQTAAPATQQQRFDAASAEAQAGKCAEAVAHFTALEHDPRVKSGSLVAAAIGVRKGICLIQLGRFDEGETAIRSSLPAMEKAGAAFALDVAGARTALGEAAQHRWDFAGAAEHYKAALTQLQGDHRLEALARLAIATAFDGGQAPLDTAEEGIRILSAAPKPDHANLAWFHALHARILLNQGKPNPAYSELRLALQLSGGLTQKTNLTEAAIRGDLATAALLTGDEPNARLYLAWTGQGRLKTSPFAKAAEMEPPLCGDETGLRPGDFAVVEFSIGDDGSVTSAQTVYSRGSPAVAAAFAKAVSGWYWLPQDAANIPVFYRLSTRVELRCSNASGGVPGISAPLDARFAQWASQTNAHLSDLTRTPETLTADRRIAEEADKSGDTASRIAALGWLSRNETGPDSKRLAVAEEAIALAERSGAAKEVIAWLRISRLDTMTGDHRLGDADRSAFLALAGEPGIKDDALAQDTLLLRVGTALKGNAGLLVQVARDPRLPEHHPLRQAAWLRLADLAAAAGDSPTAQTDFANTGLTEQQCAVIGMHPALQRSGATSDDYPDTALAWGFEGWVRLEFDVATDGKTANARAVIAYPPQIFVDAATGMTKSFRFETSYRPARGVACRAERSTIIFEMSKPPVKEPKKN